MLSPNELCSVGGERVRAFRQVAFELLRDNLEEVDIQ